MGGKNFCYIIIFVVTIVAILIMASVKLTVDFAVVVGILGYITMLAVNNT